MADDHKKPAVFIRCEACGGSGRVKLVTSCKTCQGLGHYYVHGNEVLYWDWRVDALHILLRKWNRAVEMMITFSLIALLVLSIVLLLRTIALAEFDAKIWALRFFLENDRDVGYVWLLMVPNCYLFYRMYRSVVTPHGIIEYEPSQKKKQRKVNVGLVLSQSVVKVLDDAWPYVYKSKQMPIRSLQLFGVLFEDRDVELILARLGVPQEQILNALVRQIAYYPPLKEDDSLSREVKEIMLNAYLHAYEAKSQRVRPSDVLLACIMADEKIKEILYEYKIDMVKVDNVITWINFRDELRKRYSHYRARAMYRPKGPINRSWTAAATPYLDSYSTDLTALAASGRLPLTVGRDREMDELFRIMESGKSVVIVGEKGVGKSNLIEGLANRMAAEDVPTMFNDKRLVSLSLPFLVAGAAQTGEVQERLLTVVEEIVRSGNIILVIKDIGNLVGISSAGTENVDLSDVLSQQIQNGNIWVVATTTPKDMRELVEGSALAGVIERVAIDEPDQNRAIQILESHVGFAEAKHQVFFSYEALDRIVSLSSRYLHDQFLPAKAIGLMQELAAWAAKRERKLIIGEDVAELLSRKTNIPLTQVSSKESNVLLNLEELMHNRIVGQDEAVKLVVSALRRARAELRDDKRPIVNLLFLGPTGVGKTELAKTVAATYFGDENAMIRLDMSEYQAQDSIARLIGQPGSSTGGVLTETVRAKPFSLVLLDEIEKAHPDILNIFLQVMDDGRLTDSMGRTIDFTSVILVATSNAGAHFIQDEVSKQTPIETIRDVLIREKLRENFRPEFLNRFDGIVVFKPLTQEEIFQVAGLMLKSVAKRLEKKGVSFTVTPEAQGELAKAGFDPIFGARPLRRVIQEQVDNALANYLLRGSLNRRDEVILEPGGNIRVVKAQQL